jgi:outer membrane protein assembly factor BamB
MKKLKNKIAAILISIFFILSMTASITLIPNANAHYPAWGIPTFAHIYVATDPIGVGQTAAIYIWVTPTYADEALTNDYRFHNYKLTITAPSGAVTVQDFPTCTDTTSNQGTSFVPTELGVYNLTFSFPGQNVNDYSHLSTSAYINDTYIASTASTTMTVQQQPTVVVPYPPLPTEYWTRPIFGENVIWYLVSSNWLGSGVPGYGGSTGPNTRCFSGDSMGSLTSHVMWVKTVGQPGGVAGGNNFQIIGNTWFEGTAYSQRYTNPIIVAGMLVYKEPLSFAAATGATVCVNLFTGQEIWRRTDVPALSFGYIMDYETPNYHGVYPAVLFTSSFARAFDAATGEPLFNVTTVPSGTTVIGPNGEQIKYMFVNNGTTANPAYYLCQWNSSRMWSGGATPSIQTTATTTWALVNTTTLINNVPTITTQNVSTTTTAVQASRSLFYDYLDSNTQNVSIPWRNNQPGSPSIVGAIYGDILLCINGSRPSSLAPSGNLPYNYFAVNLNASKGAIGTILWWDTVQPAISPAYGNITTVAFAGMDPAGYFCESYRQTSQFAFFNLRTGAFIKLSDPQAALDYYGSTGPGTLHNVIAFGRCYSGAMSGILYCYDMATGNVLWTYGNGGAGNTTYSGLEYPGRYPIFVKAIGGHNLNDGVVYTIYTEHTLETPITKGALTRAINASDGSEIYTFTDATGEFGAGSFAIADGYTNFFNSYDSRIYTLGRGPSDTTVTVGPKSSALGGNVVIEGTVTDVSVGLQTTEIQGRFPAGVPACADSSMKDWMATVYQQQPKPSNFTGVNVQLTALDSNNNWQDLGTVTTDSKGKYSLTYTPAISGNYQVFANFAGTSGFWPSSDETTFNVMNAPPTSSPYPVTVLPPTEMYVTAAAVAIIVAMAIIGAVIVLVLRKRP